MRKRGFVMRMWSLPVWRNSLVGGCLFFLAACSGQHAATTTLSPAMRLLRQAQAAVHDARFTIAFTTDGATNTGNGTLTVAPRRFLLTLQHTTAAGQSAQLTVISDYENSEEVLFDKLSNDRFWSTPDDAEEGNYVNFDTDILNYDQLSAVTLVGAATTAGQATWHLHATTTMPLYDETGALNKATGAEDLWLRQSDAFPLALRKTVTGSGTATDGTAEPLSLQAAYQFTAWNTGATVALPDPSIISPSG